MWKNRVVDWAFVELNNDISFRPNVMPNIPQSLNPSKFGLRLNYREGAPLAGFDQLSESEWFSKTGKSTGMTSGVCNGVKMSCHWNDQDRERFDMEGKEFPVNPEVTEEFVILDQAGENIQTDFAQPGDSGSVLVDRFGCVPGLLYGVMYIYAGINLTTYAGLAMTMPDVLETIKLKTQDTKAQESKHAVLELP